MMEFSFDPIEENLSLRSIESKFLIAAKRANIVTLNVQRENLLEQRVRRPYVQLVGDILESRWNIVVLLKHT